MAQKCWTITVPTCKNNGDRIPRQNWQALENQLLAIAGGFSAVKVHGVWKDDAGKLYDDWSRRYDVLTDGANSDQSEPILTDRFTKIAAFVKTVWQQESVLVTKSDVRFTFVV